MIESGGVLHHGTYEEDSPVTWEALSLLGRSGPTESRSSISETGASAGARAGRRDHWQNKRLSHEVSRWQGEPEPRLKEARESEGCIRALTSGNGLATRTRPSKGGPC